MDGLGRKAWEITSVVRAHAVEKIDCAATFLPIHPDFDSEHVAINAEPV